MMQGFSIFSRAELAEFDFNEDLIDLLTESDENRCHIDLTQDSDSDNDGECPIEEDESSSDCEIIDEFLPALTAEERDDYFARRTQPRILQDGIVRDTSDSPESQKVNLPFSVVNLERYTTTAGFGLTPGMNIELSQNASIDGKFNDYFRIDSILQDVFTDRIIMRGTRFRRVRYLKGMLERKPNEVFQCRRYCEEDTRLIYNQSFEDVPIEEALCERMLILTNQPYPALSRRCAQWRGFDRDSAPVVCRYSYTTVFTSHSSQKKGRVEEYRLERLREDKADPGYAVSDQGLRKTFRSPNSHETIDLTKDKAVSDYEHTMNKVRGILAQKSSEIRGTQTYPIALDLSESKVLEEEIAIEHPPTAAPASQRKFTQGQDTRRDLNGQYTFGDAFAGGGGVSCGARLAGLKIRWAFDHWATACETYQTNFPAVRVFNQDAHTFATSTQWNEDKMVDVLHMSPPCQPFALCHTIPGKNDEDNVASLFAAGHLVQRVRPRVVTIEETSGLQNRHPVFLHNLIQQLTRPGYSIRWKTMVLADYGLAQRRQRLFIVASCPGEPLPPFPVPTHGPGLRPYRTIHDCLQLIRPRMPNHDISSCLKRNCPSYDPRRLKKCITTSGGDDNLHPSGKRTFTNRELATMQGFPLHYVFCGPKGKVTTQIGNAVPPSIAEQIFKTIIAFLRATDASDARGDAGPEIKTADHNSGTGPNSAIILD